VTIKQCHYCAELVIRSSIDCLFIVIHLCYIVFHAIAKTITKDLKQLLTFGVGTLSDIFTRILFTNNSINVNYMEILLLCC
jgi:hypothetical protein